MKLKLGEREVNIEHIEDIHFNDPHINVVIKGLKCIKGDIVLCKECGYSDENGFGTYTCRKKCASDAIELLKHEQKLIEDTIEKEFAEGQQNIIESQSDW